MRKLIINLMIMQIVLFCSGIYMMTKGDIIAGLIVAIVNAVFFTVNINMLKWQKERV